MPGLDLDDLRDVVQQCELYRTTGTLRRATGLLTCTLPAAVGDQCAIEMPDGRRILAEVIGFEDGNTHLIPYEVAEHFRTGMPVVRLGRTLSAPVGDGLLGRVLDGLGRPLDGLGPLTSATLRPARASTPSPMDRVRIREPFITGQRALDSLLTFGKGQRVGIFAGSGVGKSTLLGEIAKNAHSDINIIALIGERGREVRPFLDDCLGEVGMARSVVLVATCDQTPLMRVRAAQMALTMADYYRERGADVLLMIDSLTRLAIAQREMGLSLGEPPSARGYTPSCFQLLASTVECMGNAAKGSITGILTVLVDGDDLDEPVTDAVRSFVDGHVVLDRKLAEKGHYPAINVSRSISRVANDVTTQTHQTAARKLRAIMATYGEVEDLVRIGAYTRGTSAQIDRALDLMPVLDVFLRQQVGEATDFNETQATMTRIAAEWPF